MEIQPLTLTASEACALLEIQAATLYAYVSRGLIRSEAQADSRAKVYRREDVERLAQKKVLRAAPEKAVLTSLDWGLPVLDSDVSTISDGKLYYRGRVLEELLDYSLEELVCLLWNQPELTYHAPQESSEANVLASQLSSYEALQLRLLWAGTQNAGAFDLSPEGIKRSACQILFSAFYWVSGQQAPTLLGHFDQLKPKQQKLLRTLLIVCADHELNTSTFTARCVASARSSPYAAISAALNALEGQRHGGSTRRSEAFLSLCEQMGSASAGLRRWQQQGESLPGCCHPLYPAGDPRWRVIAELLAQDFSQHPSVKMGLELAHNLEQQGLAPNIDLAIALSSRVLAWPKTEALVWFALGRLSGWLAHLQEQYSENLLIRPRARQLTGK